MRQPIIPDPLDEQYTSGEQFEAACIQWEEDMIVYEEWMQEMKQEAFENDMDSLEDYIDVAIEEDEEDDDN